MVLGSSISLNNLSAGKMQDSLGFETYNLSSWGFPIKETLHFFTSLRPPQCKYLFIAFNNIDFATGYSTDYDLSLSKYYLCGPELFRTCVMLRTFNFLQFDRDTKYKDSVIQRSALDFNKYGSVLLDPKRFPRDDNKLPVYKDTLGFHAFYVNAMHLKKLFENENGRLILVYTPYRTGTLKQTELEKCDLVAEKLKADFGRQFIDLHRSSIGDSLYWDGAHLYDKGADEMTEMMLAALQKQKSL